MLLVVVVGAVGTAVANDELMVRVLVLLLPALVQGVYHRGQLFEEAVAGDYLIMVVKEASGSDRVKMIGHERRLLRVVVVDGPVLMVIELILECGVMQLVVQVRVHPQLVDDILMNPSTA